MDRQTKEFMERCKIQVKLGVTSVILTPLQFIDIINDGAAEVRLNNFKKTIDKEPLYKHFAVYQGVPIQANTKNKIYDI